MITFVKINDLNNGVTFNGNAPFIHWFDEPVSVGLYRYKTVVFLSHADSHTISINSKSPYKIYQQNTDADTTNFDLTNWRNICDSLVSSYTTTSQELDRCDNDQPRYLHHFNIILKVDEPGEYIDSFYIDNQEYKIGAEVYGENEPLSINLANMGIEIPESIVKSIYTSDIFEDNTDWIIMNRKFRELLANYADIWMGKGNYRQLETALKWFDYGPLVELREVWKHETEDGIKLADRPITKMLTESLKERLHSEAKTTYFTIRNTIQRLDQDPEEIDSKGNPIYKKREYNDTYPDEINGESTRDYNSRWVIDEMRMKIALLGAFFETYFTPIHIDIIRSVVEEIYYDTISSIFYNHGERLELVDNSMCNDFEIESPSSNDGFDGDDYRFRLDVIEGAYGYIPDTYIPFSSPSVVGVSLNNPLTPDTDKEHSEQWFRLVSGYYRGIGAIAAFDCLIPESVKSATITTNINGNIETVVDNTEVAAYREGRPKVGEYGIVILGSNGLPEMEGKSIARIPVRLLCQTDGHFFAYMDFVGKSGNHYNRLVKFEITDNYTTGIKVSRLKYKYKDGEIPENPFEISTPIELDYMFSRERLDVEIPTEDSSDDTYSICENELTPQILSEFTYQQYIPALPSTKTIGDFPRLTKIFKGYGGSKKLSTIYRSIHNLPALTKTPKSPEILREIMGLTKPDASSEDNCWIDITLFGGVETPVEKPDLQFIEHIIVIPKTQDAVINPVLLKVLKMFNQYAESDVFIPEWHKLETIGPGTIQDERYPIAFTPYFELHTFDGDGNYQSKHVKWANNMDDENRWEIRSTTAIDPLYTTKINITEPFLGSLYSGTVPPYGYYDVTFRYRWGQDVKEIVLKNAVCIGNNNNQQSEERIEASRPKPFSTNVQLISPEFGSLSL